MKGVNTGTVYLYICIINTTMSEGTLHKEYFYFLYFKYILQPKLLYFYLGKILNARFLLFLNCDFPTFTQVKDLSTSFTISEYSQ